MTRQNQTIAKWVLLTFSVAIFLISASTSAGFFREYFELIPVRMVGAPVSEAISMLTGVTLLDLACAIWMYLLLYGTETTEQRAVSSVMSFITFLGAASASLAYLILSASGSDLEVTQPIKDLISGVSLVGVIFAVIANFGAVLLYSRFSFHAQQSSQADDERDALLDIQARERKLLAGLTETKVKVKLQEASDGLAALQAEKLVQDFIRELKLAPGSDPSTEAPETPSLRVTTPTPPRLEAPTSTAPLNDGQLPAFLTFYPQAGANGTHSVPPAQPSPSTEAPQG